MNSEMKVKAVTADPSALGLFGLAMVTLVASSQKLGFTEGFSLVIPWAVFLGAIAQLMAGMLDFKHNNVFGATAFCAYGLFWLGTATSWMINMGALGESLQESADSRQLGVAFAGYLIFTLIMTFAALETNKVLLIIFILIDVLFLGLSVSSFSEGVIGEIFHIIAAIAEFLIALASFYGCAGNVINKHFGKPFVPLGKPLGKFKR